MIKKVLNSVYPHILAFAACAFFSIFYFLPEIAENKTLPQSDVRHSLSMQTEIRKYNESEGREILWTNSIFSGMPTYQIYGGSGETYNWVQKLSYSSLLLGRSITSPVGLLFACMFGFYIMLCCFGVNWRWAIFGAIIFGLSTSFNNLIAAGHVNKVMVLALCPPTLGGIYLLLNGKFLIGTAITALFVNLQLMANHPQISYYFGFIVFIFLIFGIYNLILTKQIKTLFISFALLILATSIGVLPNLPKLLTTKEYADETIRGKTEIITKGEKPKEGLDKDYAFSYSLSVDESMSHIIPNYYGGTNGEFFASNPNSNTTAVLQSMNPEQANQLAQATTTYFGAQDYTGGAWYWGIMIVFLFFVGFTSTKHWIKWWGLSSLILIIIMSWGNHFSAFNYFLFDHFPLFNKFRVVSMIVNLGHMVLILVAIIGLKDFFEKSQTERLKVLKYCAIIMLGFVAIGLYKAWLGNLSGAVDQKLGQFPDLLNALRKDRASLIQGDTFRALLFVVLAASGLYLSIKTQISKNIILIGLAFLCLVDLITIDKRYLKNEQFDLSTNEESINNPRPIDIEILKDHSISYRVVDFTVNPFSDATISSFHKNLGGYHAAKLGIYQDVIEKYLSDPQKYQHIFSMLNAKYFIHGNPSSPQLFTNQNTKGNAWFAKDIKWVDQANQELDAISDSLVLDHVVINKKFNGQLKNKTFIYNQINQVKLTKYVPDHMTYEYMADSPQFLVFSEVYYPESKGWNIYIDGKKHAGLVRTNYILRGIEVPQGNHILEMKFEPKSYYLGQKFGKIGSILLCILIFSALAFEIKKNNKNQAF